MTADRVNGAEHVRVYAQVYLCNDDDGERVAHEHDNEHPIVVDHERHPARQRIASDVVEIFEVRPVTGHGKREFYFRVITATAPLPSTTRVCVCARR